MVKNKLKSFEIKPEEQEDELISRKEECKDWIDYFSFNKNSRRWKKYKIDCKWCDYTTIHPHCIKIHMQSKHTTQ